MPIRKAHLNREERASYLAATRELHMAGLDVTPSRKDSKSRALW